MQRPTASGKALLALAGYSFLFVTGRPGESGSFGIWSLRWGADGREIIAGTGDYSVYVYDIERRKVRTPLTCWQSLLLQSQKQTHSVCQQSAPSTSVRILREVCGK